MLQPRLREIDWKGEVKRENFAQGATGFVAPPSGNGVIGINYAHASPINPRKHPLLKCRSLLNLSYLRRFPNYIKLAALCKHIITNWTEFTAIFQVFSCQCVNEHGSGPGEPEYKMARRGTSTLWIKIWLPNFRQITNSIRPNFIDM